MKKKSSSGTKRGMDSQEKKENAPAKNPQLNLLALL